MNKFLTAFNGIFLSIKDKAVRIQYINAVLAIIGGLIIRLDYYEWLAFIICIGVVISSEIFNSCIEELADYVCQEKNERIKKIKDLSSGAVLVASLAALSIAILSLIRRIKI